MTGEEVFQRQTTLIFDLMSNVVASSAASMAGSTWLACIFDICAEKDFLDFVETYALRWSHRNETLIESGHIGVGKARVILLLNLS